MATRGVMRAVGGRVSSKAARRTSVGQLTGEVPGGLSAHRASTGMGDRGTRKTNTGGRATNFWLQSPYRGRLRHWARSMYTVPRTVACRSPSSPQQDGITSPSVSQERSRHPQ